ncbi:Rieske 2Fe-2S domain-containing protein [Pseudonocardia endophytica]|uniref:Phenylpropionate dioxygenase-like ring-hydroxylating dioxygenase large terminal subunit n=1 Tax=Pseudonocardia endophytica TaxID=401976 RepID=A0A4R1HWG3_PSEEN|nr:Rieske 2Fe-2S domain-containing protein [Pseudonocardia endophytica]TCK24339.1 phenylpropionate dioxygenase-like ring-hydroxylating dioxygenase large terminal subunit [Pseudonocardia endophytica]
MLSTNDNEILTRVGPGTPMGAVLRRYWTPALLSDELPEPAGVPVRVRLLGEDLVAFRDRTGRVGLIQENCPHRGASLYFGRNEDGPGGTCGLRCPYHGWQFDADGRCIDMPSEPPTSSFKERVTARTYPTHESGGIVWTYMGPPDTMTPFRDFGTESLPEDLRVAAKLQCYCSWLQTMEGNVDTAHISWLHSWPGANDITDDGSDKPGYPSNRLTWKFWAHDRAPRLEVHDTWYGFRYAGVRETPNGHTNVRITEYIFPYSTIIAAVPYNTSHLMVVPIDDHNCWRFTFESSRMPNPAGHGGDPLFSFGPFARPGGRRPGGITPRNYLAEADYNIDREVQRTTTFSGVADFVSQDLMVTESMGPIYDRSQERLGTIDKAIIRMRQGLLRAAKALADDPSAPLPALPGPGHDFRSLRGTDKILEDGEDWRLLGTDDDPAIREAGAVPPPLPEPQPSAGD